MPSSCRGLLVLVVFSCFVDCGSVPEASLAGNSYTYDYELLLSFTESSYLYRQSAGMGMYQDYTKTAANAVVQMRIRDLRSLTTATCWRFHLRDGFPVGTMPL